MGCESKPEMFLCVCDSFHGQQRHLELLIAKGADCDGWHGANPFDHSQITFRHPRPYFFAAFLRPSPDAAVSAFSIFSSCL
jgi:hypothetical protein